MSLQFIIGPASMDHQAELLNALTASLKAHPDDQFYYLVPNHIKFESEVQILDRLAQQAGKNLTGYAQSAVQVLSLTRLAWFFMKNTPQYQLPRVSEAGLNMLVYQSIIDHRSELKLFAGEADRPGFITMLTRQLMELKTGQVSAFDLGKVAENIIGTSADLDAKLHDLVLIYDSFDAAMANKYVANTDLLNQLSDYLEDTDLSHAHFYFDGFSQTQFSAQEMALLKTLMQGASEVKVALTVDHGTPTPETINEQSIFFQPSRTYLRLYQTARGLNVPVMTDVIAKQPRVGVDLQHLETYWQKSATGLSRTRPETVADPQAIQIIQADNRYAEVARVAATIRQLVAEKGYRYRDFLILTRHLDKYQNVLGPIMNAQEIPYFSDVSQSMADHPLVELITSLFEIKRRHYQYADLMRLLKTELMLPKDETGEPVAVLKFRDALFKTENWVLKMGYHGNKWLQKEDWPYARLQTDDLGTQTSADDTVGQQINMIRHFVRDTLPPFFKQLDNAKNGREAAQILVRFLTNAGVVDQLMVWRDQAIDAGDLVTAGQPEQTWNTFCDLLDEYVTILGDRQFVADDFLALLLAGFEGADYSQIPSTLDQVSISESGIIQMNNRKITFMIGATDKVMPDNTLPSRLLSDQDRQQLVLPEGEYLGDTGVMTLQGEPYLNYLAFMTPSERLIFTYPLSEDGESQNQISPYVAQIKQHFNLTVQTHAATPKADDKTIQPYLGAKRATLRHLVQAANDSRENQRSLSLNWQYVYHVLDTDTAEHDLTEKLLGSIAYRNQPVQLTPDIVDGLYSTTINSSISKLEEFYQNQYAYFLKYGLHLQERDAFELSPANTGEFFHASLDMLMKRVNAEHIDLTALDEQQLTQLVDEITTAVLDDPLNLQYAILNSSHRMQYIKRQLIALVQQTARAFHEQGKFTPMRAKQTEVMFGHIGAENGLPALKFDLPNEKKVQVRGKIDRIDTMKVENSNQYVGVVDYKSSAHKVDLNDIYHGIAMQMMTYLDVVQRNMALLTDDPDAELAGALYLHLKNPTLTPNDLKTDIMSAMLSKEQYKGLLVNDDDLLRNLEPERDTNPASVYPYAYTKSGSLKKNVGTIVTADELKDLLSFTELKITDAANAIFAGQLDLNPVKYPNGRTAMQYSPYKAIMQFDPMLPENDFRMLTADRDKQVILQRMQEELKNRGLH